MSSDRVKIPQSRNHRKASHRKANALRDSKILTEVAQGKNQSQVARELGVSRDTVRKALSREDIQSRVAEIDAILFDALEQAAQVIVSAVHSGDYVAARDLIKNFGGMRTRLNIDLEGGNMEEGIAEQIKKARERVKNMKADYKKKDAEKAQQKKETKNG